MATFGSLWQHLATEGNLWQLFAAYGNLWQPLATDGKFWKVMANWTFSLIFKHEITIEVKSLRYTQGGP